ncbi:chloramphenicol acetyltransferase [Flavobacterium jejuense]|uniref:Chloramphenicol acetyltransferase n=1 Tax=Flavobacterium jejuense TaxID=1544455 RepID=A0ABX0IV54_9FLAO|nr:chloramphenicol acetyltransferase [Flavobacterium jejuense]NHN25689.1 chloramphenicol acetyltransferase [Flavobacterium jejuense]
MKRLLDIETWNRKEHFEFFSKFEEPFFSITCPIDVTLAYENAKKLQIPFFTYYLHKSILAINKIENFRYRIQEDKVYIYDEIHASATIMRDDKTFGFSFMEYIENVNGFQEMVRGEITRIQNTPGLLTREFPENIIHFSAIPWINFTGLTHARSFSSPDSCPKISFGKLISNNEQKTMSMSITAHHGLVDGYHMGLFIEKLQRLLNEEI